MTFRKTLGLVTAVTALAMWPQAAGAQEQYDPIDPELSDRELQAPSDPERGPDDTLDEETEFMPFEGQAEAQDEDAFEAQDEGQRQRQDELRLEAEDEVRLEAEDEVRIEAQDEVRIEAQDEPGWTEVEDVEVRVEGQDGTRTETRTEARDETRGGTGWFSGEDYDPIDPDIPEGVSMPGDPDVPPDDTLDEVTEFDPFNWGEQDVQEAAEEVGQEAAELGDEITQQTSELADDVDVTAMEPGDELIDDALLTPFGTMLRVGGGVRNFTQDDLQDATDIGGFWDVRAGVGTRSIIGVEAAYHGSAQDIEAIGLDDEAFLVSNGLEGALRLNAPITMDAQDVPVLIEPFALAGLGWSRYNLFNEGVNTSDINDQDDVLTVPLGVGVAVGVAGVVLDGRFTYRQAFGSDLVGDATAAFGPQQLNSWSLGAGLGFEF